MNTTTTSETVNCHLSIPAPQSCQLMSRYGSYCWAEEGLNRELDFEKFVQSEMPRTLAVNTKKIQRVLGETEAQMLKCQDQITYVEQGYSPLSTIGFNGYLASRGHDLTDGFSVHSRKLQNGLMNDTGALAVTANRLNYRALNQFKNGCEQIVESVRKTARLPIDFTIGTRHTGYPICHPLTSISLTHPFFPKLGFKHCLEPRKGYSLVSASYDNLLARVAFSFPANYSALDCLGQSDSFREAWNKMYPHAAALGVNPATLLYPEVSTLPFGADTFEIMLAAAKSGLSLTPEMAKRCCQSYSRYNPQQAAMWGRFDDTLRSRAAVEMPMELKISSGRILKYLDIHFDPKNMDVLCRPWTSTKTFLITGGLLYKFLVRSLARDLLVAHVLAVRAAGYKILFFDETGLVIEVPELQGPEAAHKITEIMCRPPSWLSECPILASAEIQSF